MSVKNAIANFFSVVQNLKTPEAPHKEIGKESEVQPKKFTADSRLWRARKGEFATYRVYLGVGEKVIFHVWSCIHHDTKRRHIRIFPVSYYKDNEIVMRYVSTGKGKDPFLSGGILFGRFNLEWIPAKHRTELEGWALLIMKGVQKYDEDQHVPCPVV